MERQIEKEALEHRIRWSRLPHIYELDDLFLFCKKCEKIYIYGCAIRQEMLAKYLMMSGIPVTGYVVSFFSGREKLTWRQFPIITRAEMILDKEAGCILGLSDQYYGNVIPFLRENQYFNYFILTEYSKDAIDEKVRCHNPSDIQVEINLVNHCNLDCECCDHFAPLAEEWFIRVEDFEKDISRLSELCKGRIGALKLLGGEPLLHADLARMIGIARKYFPDSCIQVFSNGLLLNQLSPKKIGESNIWEIIKKYEVQLNVTRYPIRINETEIVAAAKSGGVEVIYTPPAREKGALLWICDDFAHKDESVKNMIRFPIDKKGQQKKYDFVFCHLFNACIVLRKGKLYTCPRRAYIDLFERYFDQEFETESVDCIDIYDAKDFEEIAEFLSKRISFCDYCALREQTVHYWQRSTMDIREWLL